MLERPAGISKLLNSNATSIKNFNFNFKKAHSFKTTVIITVYLNGSVLSESVNKNESRRSLIAVVDTVIP